MSQRHCNLHYNIRACYSPMTNHYLCTHIQLQSIINSEPCCEYSGNQRDIHHLLQGMCTEVTELCSGRYKSVGSILRGLFSKTFNMGVGPNSILELIIQLKLGLGLASFLTQTPTCSRMSYLTSLRLTLDMQDHYVSLQQSFNDDLSTPNQYLASSWSYMWQSWGRWV